MVKAFLQPHKPRHLQNHVLPPVQSLPLRSLLKENAAVIWKSIAGGLLFIPFWLVFGICIAVGNTVGSIRSALGSTRIPQMESADLLSALDALWLAQPGSKSPQSIANVVMKLGDNITMKDFVDILTARLMNVKNPRGPPPFLYMRFRQRLYAIPGSSRSVFAFSPRFDIANHVHQIPPDVDTTEKFMAFVSQIAQNPFEAEKPLWDMHIRTGFGPEKCGILLFRFHQCITDGQSMIQALCRDILDGGDQIYPQIKPRFGGLTYAGHFCQAVFMAGYIFLTDLMSRGKPDLNILKHPDLRLTGKYDIFWSEPVNISVIHRLKTITRCRFNDIIFTALAATLRTYCKMHGISTPADMTACFPVDLRSGKGEGINDLTLGNQFVLEKIYLPVSQEAGMPQLWRVRDQTYRMRKGYRHVAIDFLLKILKKALSQKLLQIIWNRHFNGCTLLVNSLAGPEGMLTVADFSLDQILMWLPPPQGMAIPVTINIITSLDQLQLVVVADTGALNDAYWIAMDFPHEVMALGNLLKTRRVPEGSAKVDPLHDLDAEKEVQQSLAILEERLVRIQLSLRRMRKKREDIGPVPALWKELQIVLPDSKRSSVVLKSSSGETGSSSFTSGSSSGSYSDSDSDDDSSGSGSSYYSTESASTKVPKPKPVMLDVSKSIDDLTASGDASAPMPQVMQVPAKPALNSPVSVNEPPKTNSKTPSKEPSTSKPQKEVSTAEPVSETKRAIQDRRISGAPAAERRMSAKPMLFSPEGRRLSLANTPLEGIDLISPVGQGSLVGGTRVVPGQLSTRRMSQAVRTIPTIVPPANRRISRS